MTIDEAIDDSENLTDFLMDFDEEDWHFCLHEEDISIKPVSSK
jgi:hypothetical protein